MIKIIPRQGDAGPAERRAEERAACHGRHGGEPSALVCVMIMLMVMVIVKITVVVHHGMVVRVEYPVHCDNGRLDNYDDDHDG